MNKIHSADNINVRQDEDDLVPRLLDQYIEEPINNIPKILRDCVKKHPHLKKIILEIEIHKEE